MEAFFLRLPLPSELVREYSILTLTQRVPSHAVVATAWLALGGTGADMVVCAQGIR